MKRGFNRVEPGQHPSAKMIIGLQAKEAEAFAAKAVGDSDKAVAKLKEAVAIEDSIDDLSQPPYPVIPANELCGYLLLDLNRPAEAAICFEKALSRTPNRPKAIFGLARAAQLQVTAKQPNEDTRILNDLENCPSGPS